jgi:hypothetical protein
MEIVFTKNGLALEAHYLKALSGDRKLFYIQDRLMITDKDNKELNSSDIINYISY